MSRAAILLFGVVAYAVFFATFLYLIAFVGNLQVSGLQRWLPWLADLVPYSVDHGRASGSLPVAIAIDVVLLLAFGLQHSAMARTGFKAWLSRQLPAAAERSVYVLVASLVLVLLFFAWRPIPQVLWTVSSGVGHAIAWTLFAAGFALVLVSTFLIDHFDLFGLRQAWRQYTGQQARPTQFVTPLFYRHLRHPLYAGFIVAFWATPVMTLGHLLFAGTLTAYVLFAIRLEERDLLRQLGQRYAQYQQQVPMLLPRLRRTRKPMAVGPGRP